MSMIPTIGQDVDVLGSHGIVKDVMEGFNKFKVHIYGNTIEYDADFFFDEYGEDKIVCPIKYKTETIINRFRDYQIEWLTGHCDIVCDPITEQVIIQFIKDTAECFIEEG